MREEKLRDFLVYFQEVDLWAEYKDKSDLTQDIQEYTEAQQLAATMAYKQYSSMREYFMCPVPRWNRPRASRNPPSPFCGRWQRRDGCTGRGSPGWVAGNFSPV